MSRTQLPAWALSGLTRNHTRVVFLGATTAPADEALAAVQPAAPAIAWARQVHGRQVLRAARAGECGEGDALVSSRAGLAVAVATADCVPVLLATPSEVGAVHAGWRGIVAGVVTAAVERLDAPSGEIEAWIGPAIGACCYEVGRDVADRIAASTAIDCVLGGDAARLHADLPRGVRHQLEGAGIDPRRIHTVEACTRCGEAQLASYRRDGRSAMRNFSYVWREASHQGSGRSRSSARS